MNRTHPALDLAWVRELPVDSLTKGIPTTGGTMNHGQIGQQGWNVLRQDLPFPVALIREDTMSANRAWMRGFLERAGVELCPHGKTTMSPELFALQIADGAFGMTCATASHLEVYRRAGVRRVILANQLVGRTNLEMALRQLRDPDFDLYCLADSEAGLRMLAGTARALGLPRPVKVLIEFGAKGARTGLRTLDGVVQLAKLAATFPELTVVGLETYEGVFAGADPVDREGPILELVHRTVEVAAALAAIAPEADEPFILTAGGSDFFDLVAEAFAAARIGRPVRVVLRGGCYLTHDSLHYARCFERMRQRSPEIDTLLGGLRPALEVWSVVQSRPEPSLAFCALGKRDISHDWELPAPISWYRPNSGIGRREAPDRWRTKLLNDQHLHLEIGADDDLRVGDLVGFGVSHPCTTFDRWRNIFLVNPEFDVIGAIRTFF